jgi:hypothetical protein
MKFLCISKLPFQNCQFGISMAAQLVKPKAAIQMCICTQLPSIGTLFDLETTNWFFARPTNTISCQQKPITENLAKKPWKGKFLFSYLLAKRCRGPQTRFLGQRVARLTLLLNEGIPRALEGKKLRLKNILLLPLIFEEINSF